MQVPGGGGGAVERQAFLIPQTYSVDQVKVRGAVVCCLADACMPVGADHADLFLFVNTQRHVFKYGDGFGDLCPDDFQLGIADVRAPPTFHTFLRSRH